MLVEPRDAEVETALDEGIGLCLDPLANRADLVEWLTRHPELAGELADGLAASAKVERLMAPLREIPPREQLTIGYDEDSTATGEPALLEFGDFELLDELGRGGMGVVFKARQKTINMIVALKTTLSGSFPSQRDVARLLYDAEMAARLDHPNIVRIFGTGAHQGMPFFIMKYVSGGTMADEMPELRKDLKKAAVLLAKVARAVHYAHQHGVIHRDLKPSNILLEQKPDSLVKEYEPMVADFGLAKTTDKEGASNGSRTIVGTASYMPPEQARGDCKLSTAADIYSLGAILYELLTGRPPFQGETRFEILQKVIEQPPVEPRLVEAKAPEDLEVICLKCLEKRSEDRWYTSAAKLADDLERFSRGEEVSPRPRSVFSHITRAFVSWRELLGPPGEKWFSITARGLSVAALAHLAIFVLVVADARIVWVWLALAGYFAFSLLQRTRQARRTRSFNQWERLTVTMWMGHLFAVMALALATIPWDPTAPADGVLAWYPALAVLYAIVMFVQGNVSWGGYFLGSFMYMALAVVLRFVGPAAPLVLIAIHVPTMLFLTRISVGLVAPKPAPLSQARA